MPAEFDRCVRGMMADPEFKPKDPKQTKKSAAFAVCTAAFKERHGGKLPSESSNASIDDLTLNDLMNIYPDLKLTVLLLEADETLEG